ERPGTTVSPGPTTPAAAASGDRRTRSTAAGGQVTWRSPATTASPPPGAGRSGTSTGDTATSGTSGGAGGCHSGSRATAGWSASVTTSTSDETAVTTFVIRRLRYLAGSTPASCAVNACVLCDPLTATHLPVRRYREPLVAEHQRRLTPRRHPVAAQSRVRSPAPAAGVRPLNDHSSCDGPA